MSLLNKGFDKKFVKKESQMPISSMLLNNDTPFVIKEAYNSIRTNIMFSVPNDGKCKKIILSSPEPGDGKTTTCINIAITLALSGAKVLLMDADMRKPMAHNYLESDNESGLSGLLNNFCSIKASVNYSSKYYFDFISSGIVPPNPVELLTSEVMEQLLLNLSEHYDFILIDTPPVNIVTDAIALAKIVTNVILIVRQGRSTQEVIDKCISNLEFADAKILGFVLNDATVSDVYTKKYYRKRYGSYYYGSEYLDKRSYRKSEHTGKKHTDSKKKV